MGLCGWEELLSEPTIKLKPESREGGRQFSINLKTISEVINNSRCTPLPATFFGCKQTDLQSSCQSTLSISCDNDGVGDGGDGGGGGGGDNDSGDSYQACDGKY